MSKPIPVFAFAFIAYAWSSYPVGGTSRPVPRPRCRNTIASNPQSANLAEGERFDAAWRFAPLYTGGFTVCVRARRLAKEPGYFLIEGAGARPSASDAVWLDEIEENKNGFVGRVCQRTERLADVLSQRRIRFSLANVAHWTFTPAAMTTTPRAELARSALDEFVISARGANRP